MVGKQPKCEHPNDATPEMDRSLLDYSLSLTPEERIELNDSAIEVIEELRRAGQKYYENQSKKSS